MLQEKPKGEGGERIKKTKNKRKKIKKRKAITTVIARLVFGFIVLEPTALRGTNEKRPFCGHILYERSNELSCCACKPGPVYKF